MNRYYFDVTYNYGEIRTVVAENENEAEEKLKEKLDLHIVEDYVLFQTEPANELEDNIENENHNP